MFSDNNGTKYKEWHVRMLYKTTNTLAVQINQLSFCCSDMYVSSNPTSSPVHEMKWGWFNNSLFFLKAAVKASTSTNSSPNSQGNTSKHYTDRKSIQSVLIGKRWPRVMRVDVDAGACCCSKVWRSHDRVTWLCALV